MLRTRALAAFIFALAACGSASSQQAPIPPRADAAPQSFNVMLAPGFDPKSGRLIVVATPAAGVRFDPAVGHPNALSPAGTSYIAAQEAPFVSPGQPTRLDADILADPIPFSRIMPGEYWVQVRLDTNHTAAYSFVDMNNDFVSVPMKLQLPLTAPADVTLAPEYNVFANKPANTPQSAETASMTCDGKRIAASPASDLDNQIRLLDFTSPALSAFWGKPVHICGLILLPPNYEATGERYPTVYRAEGFGGTLASLKGAARRHWDMMKSGDTPPMIRVFLDHSSPWGTHEFADSVNNGPWGKALTEELIPWLETQYKMDATPSGRFTTGHSSGGWFAIWQQVRYPKVFGGTWARAPDPVDFRSFTGIDIYRDKANAYVRPDGSAQYLVRSAQGCETTSFKDYTLQENVLGDFGGQIDSFDWVFSPRGIDGRAQPLFDRATGAVDPQVAAYWRDHFDISNIVKRDWKTLKPNLDGKIHLIMGTNDTFHLNEAATLLEGTLKSLNAKYDFMWMEGRNHGTLDRIDDDANGLEKKIAWEMYAVARPKSSLKPKTPIAKTPPAPAIVAPPVKAC